MPIQIASPAVAIARAHAEACSHHDFEATRRSLAADVTVTATTTSPGLPRTELAGVDEYMRGLVEFAQLVAPGSLRLIGSVGDERNALVMLTVQTMDPQVALGQPVGMLDGGLAAHRSPGRPRRPAGALGRE